MQSPLRVGIAGARGRMGRAVIALVAERNDVALAAATGRPGGGADASGGIALTSIDEMLEACEVVIDFSTAAASTDLARRAAERGGVALVLGATGFPDQDQAAIAAAAGRVAIIKSGNFSLGLNVLAGLVRQAAARLSPEDWDAEVLDWHHRRKIDAPSGTALLLGEAIAQGRGLSLSDVCEVGGRTGPRAQGAIGFAVLRGGGVVGEHTVALAAEDETITFSHSARDRGVFARGAIEAALWVRDKPPGLYGMQAVLGF